MRVFIAGASGAIGKPLVRQLLESGHAVVGLARTHDGAAVIRALGAEVAIADVYDEGKLSAAVVAARPDAVIHELTKIPWAVDPRRVARDLAPTNRLRTEGTRLLAAAAAKAGAKRFLAQSVAFAYAPAGEGRPAIATEAEPIWLDGPASVRPLVDALVALERTTLETPGLAGTVLRYGGFAGPGTAFAPGGSMHDTVSRRKLPVAGAGTGVFSFIHVEDAARATVLALERGSTGVFNVVDDTPVAVAEWLPGYAALIGAPPPRRVPGFLARLGGGAYGAHLLLRQRGASSAKARAELGFVPRYGTWRESLAPSAALTRPSAPPSPAPASQRT